MKKSASEVRSTLYANPSKAPFLQCFICRQWSYLTSKSFESELCLPCYVDILEIRQRRGAVTEPKDDAPLGEGPDESAVPRYAQLELFPLPPHRLIF